MGSRRSILRWVVLAIGFVVSFLVAYASVAWFMAWVRKHGFVPFAVYRIVAGILVLAFAASWQVERVPASAGPMGGQMPAESTML